MSRGSHELSSRVIRSLSAASDGVSTLSAELRPRQRPACASGAGRLRMTREEFEHEPVMVAEVLESFADLPQGVILDATVGGGGHAAALLAASSRHRLVGIDRDPVAVEAARRTLAPFGARAAVVRARFDSLREVLAETARDEPVVGVLFDLGVSSRQIDDATRGFSYRADAPLDMRMDPDDGESAADFLNSTDEGELARLFSEHGEERSAGRIARAVVAARPLHSTGELAEVVAAAVPPGRRRRGHPAARVFQAVRVAVNGELLVLPAALEAAMEVLVPSGRIAVISYHSGEDRLVKDTFAAAASGWCTCPPHLPCVCGAQPALRVLTRGARLPSPVEVEGNRRASSARLRLGERLDAPMRDARKDD